MIAGIGSVLAFFTAARRIAKVVERAVDLLHALELRRDAASKILAENPDLALELALTAALKATGIKVSKAEVVEIRRAIAARVLERDLEKLAEGGQDLLDMLRRHGY